MADLHRSALEQPLLFEFTLLCNLGFSSTGRSLGAVWGFITVRWTRCSPLTLLSCINHSEKGNLLSKFMSWAKGRERRKVFSYKEQSSAFRCCPDECFYLDAQIVRLFSRVWRFWCIGLALRCRAEWVLVCTSVWNCGYLMWWSLGTFSGLMFRSHYMIRMILRSLWIHCLAPVKEKAGMYSCSCWNCFLRFKSCFPVCAFK